MSQFVTWFLPFCGAFVSIMLIVPIVFAFFRRHGIVDKPHLYPHEQGRAPLPYPGGVVIVINLVLWTPWILTAVADADIKKAIYVIVAGAVTSLLMAWDDQTRSLSPVIRLGFQVTLGAFFGLTAIKIGYVTNIF